MRPPPPTRATDPVAAKYLELKYVPAQPRFLVRLYERLALAVLEFGSSLMRHARKAYLMLAERVSTDIQIHAQTRLSYEQSIIPWPITLGFDYDKWQASSSLIFDHYRFVPSDSIKFHSDRVNNKVSIFETTASIVLFQSSHPLLFLKGKNEFVFEKLHEIPYHGLGSPVNIIDFKWDNKFRPSFCIACDMRSHFSTFSLNAPVIYIGGSLNYGHFFTDYYPRLLALIEAMSDDEELATRLPRQVALLCEGAELEYVRSSHPEFEFLNLKDLDGAQIEVDRLYTTNYIAFPMAISLLRRHLQGADLIWRPDMKATTAARSPGRKVFLSRRGLARRRIENEEELIEVLEKRGFEIIQVLDYSISEMSQSLRDFDLVLSGFGAHTVNAIFLSPGSTFIEVVPKSFDVSHGWQYNHSLFFSAGLQYIRLVTDDSKSSGHGVENATGLFDWSGRVDIESVIKTLDELQG